MKIILLENVAGLGIVGDRKEVSEGYARNYLLPKKLAVKIGNREGKILLKNISKKRSEAQKEMKKIEKVAEDYKDKEIVFELKATDKGKLFGSIGPAEVAEKLKIDKKQVNFPAIRETGEHRVKIDFGHNVKTTVKIIIKAK